jgi:hypothetical protein
MNLKKWKEKIRAGEKKNQLLLNHHDLSNMCCLEGVWLGGVMIFFQMYNTF